MKIKNTFVTAASASLILALLTACNVFQPTPIPTPLPTQTPQSLPATGVQYFFVANKLQIPTTQEQTQAFAFNVDGDAQNSLDNKFGDLFTLLASTAQGVELQATLDQAVNAGQVVTLHVVKANDPLDDTSVSWSIFLGQKTQSAPKFDGSDNFKIDSTAPVTPPIIGSLTNGHFTGGPGNARVQLFLLGKTVDVDLTGVRLEADLSANGCADGKLGGGLSIEEFRGKILPAVTEGLNLAIKADQNVANTLLPLFDSDRNGTTTVEEFESNPLLMMAVSPDLDMLDASGNFNPNQDGVKDSYSLGLGFTCVPAVFTAPEK
ncbi:MAG: hypothetical protein PHQ36_02640 [Anaerolineales bacterium]|nr:hypothetical protein [Anaerolineales bacterium]